MPDPHGMGNMATRPEGFAAVISLQGFRELADSPVMLPPFAAKANVYVTRYG